MSTDDIEVKAVEVLRKTRCLRVPVPVDVVAVRLGLRLREAPLGEGVSGVLLVEGGSGTIGYNEGHHPVRQRFSIAHEIGHYILHAVEDRSTGIFIDKQPTAHLKREYRRDSASSTGEKSQEIQANGFAAALLMPKELVVKEVEGLDPDIDDEDAISELATTFEVSPQAMSLRLAKLGYVENAS
jgi:Zn-dependent peptidase ImmA (M78 family)